MTLFAKPFRLVAAAFYRIAYKLHHKLFLRPQPPIQAPVIIVGAIWQAAPARPLLLFGSPNAFKNKVNEQPSFAIAPHGMNLS